MGIRAIILVIVFAILGGSLYSEWKIRYLSQRNVSLKSEKCGTDKIRSGNQECVFNHCGTDTPLNVVNISLIIPCYHDDWWALGRVLESVANQTKRPAETLVILSTDGTAPELQTQVLYTQDEMLCNSVSMKLSMYNIPNLKIYARAGEFYASHNRMYGVSKAKYDLVSFFDCDDYLHPQKFEVLDNAFKQSPDVDVVAHGYAKVNVQKWDVQTKYEYVAEDFSAFITNTPFFWDHTNYNDEMEKVFPEPWNISDPRTEPFRPHSIVRKKIWCFSGNMDIPFAIHPVIAEKWRGAPHNAWLTLKKKVLRLVPYPMDTVRSEDCIYTYRLLKSRAVNFNYIYLPIAAYLLKSKYTLLENVAHLSE